MGRFVTYTLLSLALLVLGMFLLYRPIPASGDEDPSAEEMIREAASPVAFLGLGTSHVWNIDLRYSNLEGIVFKLGGNTPYYDLQNYRYLNQKGILGADALVVVQVSYFVFGIDENRSDGLVGDSFLNQYYAYLPPRYIHEYSLDRDLKLITYRIQQNFRSLVKRRTKNPEEEWKSVSKNVKNTAGIEDSAPDVKELILNRHAKSRAKNHRALSSYDPESRSLEYLETLLEEIAASGHRAVLLTTPYFHAYNEYMGVDWLESSYFPRMQSLAETYHLPYLNYGLDQRFTLDPHYYHDCDHLNELGKELFNRTFFRDLDNALQTHTY